MKVSCRSSSNRSLPKTDPKSWFLLIPSHFRGTDYVQQKKQYNQTIKPPGELNCVVAKTVSVYFSRYRHEQNE